MRILSHGFIFLTTDDTDEHRKKKHVYPCLSLWIRGQFLMSYSLDTLEFPRLLDLVASHAQTPMGAARVSELKPLTSRIELEHALAAVDETMALNERQVTWSFSGLGDPTQLASKIFAAGRDLLAHETDGTRFRLIGIGVSEIAEAEKADPTDLLDLTGRRNAAAEHAVDRLRAKFGRAAVVRGLALDSDGDQ